MGKGTYSTSRACYVESIDFFKRHTWCELGAYPLLGIYPHRTMLERPGRSKVCTAANIHVHAVRIVRPLVPLKTTSNDVYG